MSVFKFVLALSLLGILAAFLRFMMGFPVETPKTKCSPKGNKESSNVK